MRCGKRVQLVPDLLRVELGEDVVVEAVVFVEIDAAEPGAGLKRSVHLEAWGDAACTSCNGDAAWSVIGTKGRCLHCL